MHHSPFRRLPWLAPPDRRHFGLAALAADRQRKRRPTKRSPRAVGGRDHLPSAARAISDAHAACDASTRVTGQSGHQGGGRGVTGLSARAPEPLTLRR